MKNVLLFSLVLLHDMAALAQDTIRLKNPSFEARSANPSTVPSGWINLGLVSETPSDIQPGHFAVDLSAQNGRTYVGMVVRENNTWEGIGQRLDKFLQKDSAYSFSIFLTRSHQYLSPTKTHSQSVNFEAPTILKIWGYNTTTQQEELLAESAAVSHSEWTKYSFILKPTLASYDELDLMAYYAVGFEKQNGNLLLDNCSAIVKIVP